MNSEHRSGDGPVVNNVVDYHSNIQMGKINTETDILPNMFLFESQTKQFLKVQSLQTPDSRAQTTVDSGSETPGSKENLLLDSL